MYLTRIMLASLALVKIALASSSANCLPFPASMIEFSANFKQPEPPLIESEYQTHFIQHKWNQNVSHITSGYINNSPSKRLVRVNEAFEGVGGADGVLNGTSASSVFNYANVTKEGLVDNTLITYGSDPTKPAIWRGYVNSNFPIIERDILVEGGAVFGGLVHRQLVQGYAAAWNIMYEGAVPVTVFINNCNVVVGYDYFSPGLRTRVVTMFFNTKVGTEHD